MNPKIHARLSRLMPGIFPLDRSRVFAEIFAGVSLAAMNIPQAMGYARLAGVPVIAGLYTLLFPVITFAILGGSRYLFVAADSATAVILSTGIAPMAPRGTDLFLSNASIVALMTGGMLLLARIMRLGFVADFLSRTVLIGFLSGVGVQIGIAVLGQMLRINVPGSTTLGQLGFVIKHIGSTHQATLLLSLIVMVAILGFRRWFPRFPGALLVFLWTIALSALLNFERHGIVLIGPVSGGIPPIGIPEVSWNDIRQLLPVAGACFIMIITQSSATARAFGVKHRKHPDENRDLLGLGLANTMAGLSGTFVVNGSPTQTAMLESCGGRSQLANLATAISVGLVLIFLTGPLKFLPLCVLGAIVFLVALRLIDLKGFCELWKCSRKEFYVALFTAGCVILMGVEFGIVLALIVSLLNHVRRGYQPRTAVVMRDPEIHWRMEKAEPGRFAEPGVILYWFGTDLYYANVTHFSSEIRRLVEESPGVKVVIVDCGPVTSIDFTAGKALAELRRDLNGRGVILALTRVTEGLRKDLEKRNLIRELGEKNLFRSRKQSLVAFRDSAGMPSSTS
jgi:sulfate permease, SulP family